jgi:hypothetical protein
MIPRRFLFCLIPVFATGCPGCEPSGSDGGSDAGPQGRVVINEIMAANRDAHVDENGENDDWIELVNTSDADVDLSGLFLSDDSSTPQKFVFANGTTLAGAARLVVFADDTPAQGPLHAAFKLSKGGEEVVLSDANGVLDMMAFGPQCEDVSFGRSPDGNGAPGFLSTPTPGEENSGILNGNCEIDVPNDAGVEDAGTDDDAGVTAPAIGVVLNEALVTNVSGLVDEAGDHEPWVEFFSTANTARDLSQHWLSDNDALPHRWRIPDGTSLAPGAFLIVFLDGEPFEGSLHAAFRFTGGTLTLRAPDDAVVDVLTVGTPDADVSVGRAPDGSENVTTLALPTPGAANDATVDGGVGSDAGLADAGLVDAGLGDAGLVDAGSADAGVTDAGADDAGLADAGSADAGANDGGV